MMWLVVIVVQVLAVLEAIFALSGYVVGIFVLWNLDYYLSVPLSSAGACYWAFWIALILMKDRSKQ